MSRSSKRSEEGIMRKTFAAKTQIANFNWQTQTMKLSFGLDDELYF